MRSAVLIVMLFVFYSRSIETELSVEHAYDLRSDFTFIKYLPKRLKKLERLFKNNFSIKEVQKILDADTDKDSYFFILQAKEPYKFLATSGPLTWIINKTISELQQEVFHDCTKPECSVDRVIKQLVGTAYMGESYVPFMWRYKPTDQLSKQVAYVTLYQASVVLGVGMRVDRIPHHLILSHRIKVLLKILKKDGLERLVNIINNNPDKTNQSLILSAQYPFRFIAHTENLFILKTPQEVKQIIYPNCTDEICEIPKLVQNMISASHNKEDYFAYITRNPSTITSKPVDNLMISAIQKFRYNGKEFILRTGYSPFDAPLDLIPKLTKRVRDVLKLIGEVGLENAVSIVNKENKPEAYLFIDEMDPPYKPLAHGYTQVLHAGRYETMTGKSKLSPFNFDIMKKVKSDIRHAQAGGGLVAGLWKKNKPNSPVMLKVTFLKPLYIRNKSYDLGTGYLFE